MSEPERKLAVVTGHYSEVHHWVRRKYGRADHCEIDPGHESKVFEWANVTGVYEKSLENFKQMCKRCHRKYDVRSSTRVAARRRMRGNHLAPTRKVSQYSMDGERIRDFESLHAAERATGILHTSIINNLKGRSNEAGGYKWRYLI